MSDNPARTAINAIARANAISALHYRQNIRLWLDTADAGMWEQGRNWYSDARAFSRWLAETYGISVEQAAGVLAVLSPRVDWDTNMRTAVAVCAQWNTGEATVATVLAESGAVAYGPNVAKALWILDNHARECDGGKTCTKVPGEGFETCAPVHGPKVSAFYRAILGASIGTIDVWAYRAATIPPLQAMGGIPMSDVRRDGIPGDRHEYLANAYTDVGSEFGLTGAECQAIVWLAIRVFWGGRRNPNQLDLPF